MAKGISKYGCLNLAVIDFKKKWQERGAKTKMKNGGMSNYFYNGKDMPTPIHFYYLPMTRLPVLQ